MVRASNLLLATTMPATATLAATPAMVRKETIIAAVIILSKIMTKASVTTLGGRASYFRTHGFGTVSEVLAVLCFTGIHCFISMGIVGANGFRYRAGAVRPRRASKTR